MASSNGNRRGEEMLQRAVFEWIFHMEKRYPVLQYAFHVPNGGARSKAEGGVLKACGVRSGIPDILIPVQNGRYHGLALELKYDKNKTSENQVRWLGLFADAGYLTGVAYTTDEALQFLSLYLDFSDRAKQHQRT